ncbi:MAG: peptidylprolyl isomerase [Magnetospirillum sp.]|nr:peptidylprolyl isomerase [Magnetospirillum sp.]
MFARLVVSACAAFATVAAAVFVSAPAAAQVVTDRIAAVINDEVITVQDLTQRVRLALMLSNLPDGAENRRRVVSQVLRKMIDERLQIQEAARFKITATPLEIENHLINVERQNRMPKGSLLNNVVKNGIDAEAVREQVRADLVWMKVAMRVIQPQIRVGEEEVNDRLEAIQSRQGKPEFLLGEIFLAVDAPAQEDDARKLAERLLEQLRAGAPFQSLARQFSQSASAASGGLLGWQSADTLDVEIAEAVEQLAPNGISPLIRSATGFHIVTLADRRVAGSAPDPSNTRLGYALMVLPLPPKGGPPKGALIARARDLTAEVRSCAELTETGAKLGATMQTKDDIVLGTLPAELRRVMASLPLQRPSEPIDRAEGISVAMVCARNEASVVEMPSREQVRNKIEDERLDVLAKRRLRDLRRSAFVDVRI